MAEPETQNQPTQAVADTEQPSQVTRHQSDKIVSNKEQNVVAAEKAKSTSFLPLDSAKSPTRQDSHELHTGIPRTSTQMSRKAQSRKSHEFDRRVDGPFGRPSLTMTRRASHATLEESMEEAVPAIPAEYAPDGATPQRTPESVEFQPEPPPLNYDLWSRKWWIIFFWSLVVFDSVVCPVALYFGLWYGLHKQHRMSANTVFSIVTAAVGGMSILEYFLRLWKLVKKTSTCRVIGAKWWHLDFFHWNFTFGWIIIMIELIV